MSKNITPPTTSEGISRLARDIKREQGIPHHQALNQAAVYAGFQNHRHAQRELAKKLPLKTGHQIFITCYWKDKDSGMRGRETLSMVIDRPLTELVTSAQLKMNPRLGRCNFEGPDHLAVSTMSESQTGARERVCTIARTVQFMNATGLKPCRGIRAYPKSDPNLSIPEQDHATTWYDPVTQRYLLVDEPYHAAAIHGSKEREAWAIKHNFNVALSSWLGMYNPEGGSRLYLISGAENGVPLDHIVEALEHLPAPIVPSVWTGESAPFPPPFISPGAIVKHEESKQRKANSTARTPQKRNTVQYVSPLSGPDRRPDAKMPVEAHQQVGQLMKSVLADSYYRRGVYNRINSVRCELDEWVQREYSRAELQDEVFFKLYYQAERTSFIRQLPAEIRTRHLESLRQVKASLIQHYPDCAPLRRLLNKLDGAIASMDSWA